MGRNEYRVYVSLEGGTVMLLCTVQSADALAALMLTLCSQMKPAYSEIKIEIVPTGAMAG